MTNYPPISILFYTRKNRNITRDHNVYCCIKIKGQKNKEICVEKGMDKNNWDIRKGKPKQKSDYLIKLGIHFECIRTRLLTIYLNLKLQEVEITVEKVRDIYLGKESENFTLLELIDKAIIKYEKELSPGSMKNYGATRAYVEAFCKQQFKSGDIPLKLLTSPFIDKLKTFILTYPLKSNDRCTNNGCMKHLERVKKIIKWAYEMEYMERNVFGSFKLCKKRFESKVLTWEQIRALTSKRLQNPMLDLVRDLFLFSCYTGMAPFDLQNLKPHQIYTDNDGLVWLKYTRAKSIITATVPLLKPAIELIDKYNPSKSEMSRFSSFPPVTNKDLNSNLKLISEICEIGMPLNFYMARHTFATTVTLHHGVPITSIKEMMGHEKIESTMLYAKTNNFLIGSDMMKAQEKMMSRDK